MKKNLIFAATIIIISIFSINTAFSQEPGPPKIPEPSPGPKPIKIPDPEPIQEPFPAEGDAEKIKRLTEENTRLKEKIFNL